MWSQVREVPKQAVLWADCVNFVAAAYDKIICPVDIETPVGNSHALELIVDTAASVSVLPETMCKQYFANCLLRVKLVSYAKSVSPVTDCLPAAAAIVDLSNKFPASFSSLLLQGLEYIKTLKISITGWKVNYIM